MLTGTADPGDATASATTGRLVAQRRGGDAGQTDEETDGIAGDSDSDLAARPRRRADLLAFGSYLLGALFVISPLLADYGRRVPNKPGDRAQAEVFLAHAAYFVTHGGNPFHIGQLNAPFGVNAMANTSMLALSLPMSPITLLFGAKVSFDVLIVIGLAGTAAAWYWVLSRHVVSSRTAAWIGGLVGGFAPTVTSHATYHPNLVAQFLVPLLAWRSFKLLEQGRAVRNGLLLAALVVAQAFINEEMLFLAALGIGLLMLLCAVQRRDRVRSAIGPLAAGLGVTTGASLVALAYPLYYQFAGPGSYNGGESYMTGFRMDVTGLTSYGSNSVAERLRRFGTSSLPFGAEEHGFFGWSLTLLLVALIVWQWQDLLVRCLAITGGVFAALAWGNPLQFKGRDTGIPGPFALLEHLPLFDTLLPTRLGEVSNWAAAPLLALGVQRLVKLQGVPARTRRILMLGLLGAALVPAAPMPVKVETRPAVPAFVTSGAWRDYVGPGQSVLVVPLPQWDFETGLYWSAETGARMPISHGYFLGPADGVDGHHAFVGPVPRPTDKLFATAMYQDKVPPVTDADRAQARADVQYWKVSLILVPDDPRWASERETVAALYGPGKAAGGLTMWDVRALG
ncbi:glycosyltransferase family protein [Dactylosporangium darangshiense]|uniref:hypothetical protein n=1 Tax=Dactylosporangium darangshiense TaxID=579108 RepID=UPI00362FB3EB